MTKGVGEALMRWTETLRWAEDDRSNDGWKVLQWIAKRCVAAAMLLVVLCALIDFRRFRADNTLHTR